jgi:hypothetical protein
VIKEIGHTWSIKGKIWVCEICKAQMKPYDGFWETPPKERYFFVAGKYLKLLRGPSKCSFIKRFLPWYWKEQGEINHHEGGSMRVDTWPDDTST